MRLLVIDEGRCFVSLNGLDAVDTKRVRWTQRYLWLTVRKALLMLVAAIERVYGKENARWEG